MSNFNAQSVSNFNRKNAELAVEYFLNNTWYVNDDQAAAMILAELGENYDVGNISYRTYSRIDQANDRCGLSLAHVVEDGLNRALAESQMTYEELEDLLEEIDEEARNYDDEIDNTEGFVEWRERICMLRENAYKESEMSSKDLEDKIVLLFEIAEDVDQDEIWYQTWNHIERDWNIIYSRMTSEEISQEFIKTKKEQRQYDQNTEDFLERKAKFLEEFLQKIACPKEYYKNKPALEVLRESKKVVLIAHVRPDGDTIGSCVALKRALEHLGKEVCIFCADNIDSFRFLVRDGEILNTVNSGTVNAAVENADVAIAVDCNCKAQLGDLYQLFDDRPIHTYVKMIIDHHETKEDLFDKEFIDPLADSAGSLVFHIIKSLGVEITKEIAEPLFVAIATDTGWFKFDTVNAGTFERVAELIKAGVNPSEISNKLKRFSDIKHYVLEGLAKANTELLRDGKIAISSIGESELEWNNATPADLKGIPALGLGIKDVELSIFYFPIESGGVQVELRSKDWFDCAAFAKRLGGGGHKKAAGITFKKDEFDHFGFLKWFDADFK